MSLKQLEMKVWYEEKVIVMNPLFNFANSYVATHFINKQKHKKILLTNLSLKTVLILFIKPGVS
jgi:hypothetical protein